MPDITMCNGKRCEMREICYRYTATPSKHRQSYFIDSPNNGLECDYLWEIECEYCHLTDGNHKMSCPTMKIQVYL
jgi:hypothetical protein